MTTTLALVFNGAAAKTMISGSVSESSGSTDAHPASMTIATPAAGGIAMVRLRRVS